jgi:hypothetical protein
MTGGGDGFLSRWSRRKAEMREEGGREEAAPAQASPEPAEIPGESDEEALRRLGLPDPDNLREGDDFTVFLGREVPAALRRRALRRLWRINPALAGLDGLVEYGEDFTGGEAAGAVETVYRVGQGFMKQMQEAEEEPLSPADGDRERGEGPPAAAQTQAPAAPRPAQQPAPASSQDNAPGDGAPSRWDADEAPLPPPRRMRFRFE